MDTKRCCRCKEMLPIASFCKSRSTGDGYDPRCRSCRAAQAKRYLARPEVKARRAAYAIRWRLANPETYVANYRKQNAKQANIAKRKISTAAWERSEAGRVWRKAHRDPVKVKAHLAVRDALADGTLIRPDACEHCSEKCKPQGHHHDYSKPLDVVWLCPTCHNRLHRKAA